MKNNLIVGVWLLMMTGCLVALDIPEFDDYLTKFNKKYDTTEKAARLIIYNQNKAKLLELDANT